jgi:hypothetical protein
LKTDGVNLAGIVKTQANLRELGLKDGQKIIGRILSVSADEVWLQLAGKTLAAQLEGQPLLPGAVVLFRVALAESGKVELKVLTNLTKPATETITPGEADLRTWIATACRQLGWEDGPAQVDQIYRDLQLFTAKYGQTPPPEIFVWLKTQNWPSTPGTILLAWLYQDQELRNLLWTRLRWNAQLKQQPGLLPQVWDPADSQLFDATLVNEQSALTDPALPAVSKTESKSVWEQLQPLLEKSLNLDQDAAASSTATPPPTVLPFLIQTTAALVTELRIKWSSKPKSGDTTGREELIRMVIPTENLGDIYLTVLLSTAKTQINFKVASPTIQEYLNRNLDDLKRLMNEHTSIVVGVTAVNHAAEAKVDLWM